MGKRLGHPVNKRISRWPVNTKRYVIFISNQGNAKLKHYPPTEMVTMKSIKSNQVLAR